MVATAIAAALVLTGCSGSAQDGISTTKGALNHFMKASLDDDVEQAKVVARHVSDDVLSQNLLDLKSRILAAGGIERVHIVETDQLGAEHEMHIVGSDRKVVAEYSVIEGPDGYFVAQPGAIDSDAGHTADPVRPSP